MVGRITLYLDNQTKKRLKAVAKAAGTSQSQWVANLIRERTSLEWPSSIAALAGSWKDDDFDEIRREATTDRSTEPP